MFKRLPVGYRPNPHSDGQQKFSLLAFKIGQNSILYAFSPHQTPSTSFMYRFEGVFCEEIGQVDHATRVLSGTEGDKSVLGTKATFTCHANYRMPEVGDVERTCQQDGTWSGTQPRCVGKLC